MSLLRHTARRSLNIALVARGPAALTHQTRAFSISLANGKDDKDTNRLKQIHDKSVESLERNGEKLIDHLEGKARTLGTDTYKTQAFVTDKAHAVGDKAEDAGEWVKDRAENAKDHIEDLGDRVEDRSHDVAEKARKAARKVGHEIDEAQESVKDSVKAGAKKVGNFVKESVEKVKHTVRGDK
ncbi:hypothetical protein BGZ81_007829 [Podila clonocystis]|nr:hypothetical protein BGZ81_007829 [Podila clonocystis]